MEFLWQLGEVRIVGSAAALEAAVRQPREAAGYQELRDEGKSDFWRKRGVGPAMRVRLVGLGAAAGGAPEAHPVAAVFTLASATPRSCTAPMASCCTSSPRRRAEPGWAGASLHVRKVPAR